MAREPFSSDKVAVAGGVAGIVEGLVVQPLDMVKTRMHLMSGAARPSVSVALSDLVREGGVPRLYRGLLPELAAMTPKSSAMYASKESAAHWLCAANGGHDSVAVHFAAGLASGVPEATVVTPFQVVKVRLQAREHLGRYHDTFHCVRRVLAEEGAAALLTGFWPTVMRNSVWNAVYFGTMHGARRWCTSESDGESGALKTVRTAVIGFAAGVFATCFNAPFDVAKSRAQSARDGAGGEFTLVRLAHSFRTEGILGLYAGFTAKALRMGVGGAVGIVAFEGAASVLARL
jgi:solute carrier family 25 2-oxodicarboxylate transporter 21